MGGGLAQIEKFKKEQAKLAQQAENEIRKVGLTQMRAEKQYQGEVRKSYLMRMRAEDMYQAEVRRTGLMQSEALQMNADFDAGLLDGQGKQIKNLQSSWSGLDHVLKTAFLAYGALRSVQAITQSTVTFGQTGAQQLRTLETFQNLGDRIGEDSEKMAAAVKSASNSSISDMQAMQLSANVLAQRFAGDIEDISGDTATLARASRRLAQIYTDENGELLTTEQVFSRLIKFAREGNKELVDQFGISNELIAQTLGIPNEGLRGAEGAADRWRGMVQILNEELERLGEPVDSTADRMEQAFAKMTTAMDKLRQASAEPITVTVEVIAGGVESFATTMEAISAIKEAQSLWEESQTKTSASLDMVRDSLGVLNNALATGKMKPAEYAANVMLVVDAYHKMESAARRAGMAVEESIPSRARDNAISARARGVVAGTIPLSQLSEEEQKFRMSVGNSREQMDLLKLNLDGLVIGSKAWLDMMEKIIALGNTIAEENQQLRDAIRGKVGDYHQAQLGVAMSGADTAGQIALLEGFRDTLVEGSLEDLKIQEKIGGLQTRLAEENARAWQKSAKEVESLFKSAADKIMGIPGVTSLTPVTQSGLDQAKYGVYREQPDEFVRRARDELLNGVNRPDVSKEQVAKLTGLPSDLPGKILISRLEEKWQSGSLFSDKANLSLLNMDSIRGRYNDMKAGQQGRANERQYIMSQLGVSASDAAMLTGQQAPIVGMLTGGLPDSEVSTQLQQSLTGPFNSAIGEMDFAKPMIDKWTGELNSDDGQKGLKGLGKIAALGFFQGFEDNIGESGFAAAIISAIKADIAKALADMANNQ